MISLTLCESQPGPAFTGAPTLPPRGRHEAELHRAQAEILDRELALRHVLAEETNNVIAAFDALVPLLREKNQIFHKYSEQLAEVRGQLEQMKERERTAELPAELTLPALPDRDREFLRKNARRALAIHAYSRLFPTYLVLQNNLPRLLIKIADSTPTVAPQLRAAVETMAVSARRIAGLGAAFAARRVALGEATANPKHVTQAQAIWQELLSRHATNAYLQSLTSGPERPARRLIAYVSFGGLGDALLQTPCIAALKRRLHPCDVVVIHSRGVIHPLMARNRSIAATLYAEDHVICRVPDALKLIGVFDAVFESRFVVWGELCAGSRITRDDEVAWIRSTQSHLETFAPYVERFPHYNNLFSRLVSPRMLLDVHGTTTKLPVTVDSPLVFCPSEADAGFPQEQGLVSGKFVTVHDGFDESFGKAMGITRCTKQLPTGKWQTIIEALRRDGLRVVQVGAAHEPLLPGVELDLRGRTSLSQLAFVLKGAVVHIDTEGGIVHMARAVHRRSIVFFGTTSVTFWGYPQNNNLTSEEYVDCWWVNSDWMARSPVNQRKSAMEAFDVSTISRMVAQEQNASRAEYRLEACHVVSRTSEQQESAAVSAPHDMEDFTGCGRLHADTRVVVVGPVQDDLLTSITARGASVEVIDVRGEHAGDSPLQDWVSVQPGSIYNLPANSTAFDLVICDRSLDEALHPGHAFAELLRLLRPGGRLALTFTIRAREKGPGLTLEEASLLLRTHCGLQTSAWAEGSNSSPDEAVVRTTVRLTRTA